MTGDPHEGWGVRDDSGSEYFAQVHQDSIRCPDADQVMPAPPTTGVAERPVLARISVDGGLSLPLFLEVALTVRGVLRGISRVVR